MDGRGPEDGKDDGWPTTRLEGQAAGARRVSPPPFAEVQGLAGWPVR